MNRSPVQAIADNDEQIVIMGTSQENISSKKMFHLTKEVGKEHLLALSFKLEQSTCVLSVHSDMNDDEYVYNKTFY